MKKTIKCPFTKCQAEVQLKKYKDHVFENKSYTFKTVNGKLTKTFSTGFMNWDGISANRGAEFDLLSIPDSWIFRDLDNCIFYMKYYPAHRSLVIAVIMAKVPKEVEQYSATITIHNKTMETSYKCPIIPIKQFSPNDDLIHHNNCWNINYLLFRKFFNIVDLGGPENHNWQVTMKWKVEINKKC